MPPRNTNIDLAELVAADIGHHFHPFTDHKAFHAEGGPRVITHAEGVCDLGCQRATKILDAMAGLWCVNVGYGRKELADAAYEQMLDLPYYNTFFKTTTVPATQLADKIAASLPKRFQHVFFINSGSEANDTIVRFVRHYWALAGQALPQPHHRPPPRLSRLDHGRGHARRHEAACTAKAACRFPASITCCSPTGTSFGGDLTPEEFGLAAADELEKKILELGPDNVAAFIGEPVQGAGGVIIPPPSYWPAVEDLPQIRHAARRRRSDLRLRPHRPLVRLPALRRSSPTSSTMAKGLSSGYLPIGAVAVADHLIAEFFDKGGEFFHGYTYSGHPVACAVALENIRIMQDEEIVERGRASAPYLETALAGLADHPLVGEVRSIGLLGAIELVRDKATAPALRADQAAPGSICRDHCFRNGLIMRACWDTMVFAPPLIIDRAEIDEWMVLARRALDMTLEDVSRG